MSGLRYEVHRMPPGMRDKVVAQVLAKVSAGAAAPDQGESEKERVDPCVTCLRWEECMGVDDACPHRQKGMLMPWKY